MREPRARRLLIPSAPTSRKSDLARGRPLHWGPTGYLPLQRGDAGSRAHTLVGSPAREARELCCALEWRPMTTPTSQAERQASTRLVWRRFRLMTEACAAYKKKCCVYVIADGSGVPLYVGASASKGGLDGRYH